MAGQRITILRGIGGLAPFAEAIEGLGGLFEDFLPR